MYCGWVGSGCVTATRLTFGPAGRLAGICADAVPGSRVAAHNAATAAAKPRSEERSMAAAPLVTASVAAEDAMPPAGR